MTMDSYFKGFRVLVTGASGGIGKAVVKELLSQGAKVGLHYYRNKPDVSNLIQDTKADPEKDICLLSTDLTNMEKTERLFGSFVDWAGGIDGLVNNAGDVHVRKHFSEISEADIDADISLNLKAPFWLSRLAINNMEKNGTRGSIVNISSIAAKYGGSPQTLFYGLAKSALETMTFSMGRYCAPMGISINALRLSVFDTPFHQRHIKNLEERVQMIPAKRMGNPAEAAWWIICLLNKNTSFMNGQTISLTGGE